MENRWLALCRRIETAPEGVAETLYLCLAALYQHPPRAYHTLQHIAECLRVFDEVSSHAASPDAVEFALWLHDCVYVPGRKDNEERSAMVADMMLGALTSDEPLLRQVRPLILATKHDGQAATPDERLLADVDLAILAADPARYDEYTQQIRREFSFAGDEVYQTGRRAFLQTMLQRPVIFATDALRGRWEAAARANLVRELRELT